MRRVVCLGLAAVVISGPLVVRAYAADPHPCDHPEIIKFAPGESRIRVSNNVFRGYDACYLLHARAGQTLSVHIIKDEEENVGLDVYAPGFSIEPNPGASPIVSGKTIGRVKYDAEYDRVENEVDSDPKVHISVKLKDTGGYMLDAGVTRGGGGSFTIEFGVK